MMHEHRGRGTVRTRNDEEASEENGGNGHNNGGEILWIKLYSWVQAPHPSGDLIIFYKEKFPQTWL